MKCERTMVTNEVIVDAISHLCISEKLEGQGCSGDRVRAVSGYVLRIMFRFTCSGKSVGSEVRERQENTRGVVSLCSSLYLNAVLQIWIYFIYRQTKQSVTHTYITLWPVWT